MASEHGFGMNTSHTIHLSNSFFLPPLTYWKYNILIVWIFPDDLYKSYLLLFICRPGRSCNLLLLCQLHSDVALISPRLFSHQIEHRHRQSVSLAARLAQLVYFLPLLGRGDSALPLPWASERREMKSRVINRSWTVIVGYTVCRKLNHLLIPLKHYPIPEDTNQEEERQLREIAEGPVSYVILSRLY